jgi:hypothetical protein
MAHRPVMRAKQSSSLTMVRIRCHPERPRRPRSKPSSTLVASPRVGRGLRPTEAVLHARAADWGGGQIDVEPMRVVCGQICASSLASAMLRLSLASAMPGSACLLKRAAVRCLRTTIGPIPAETATEAQCRHVA